MDGWMDGWVGRCTYACMSRTYFLSFK